MIMTGTKRTLSITTYQFVEVAELKLQDEIASHLGSLGICKTRVKGNGVSLVKVHDSERSSASTLCHWKNVSFMNSRQLLVTVDGGGDERPHNKITQFCEVLVRWLLDLDKYKCHSPAEGSTKCLSVERLHTAENRMLSQCGEISSRLAHTGEVSEQGVFYITKFEQNMKLVQDEAVKRIDYVTYSNDKTVSYSAPEVKDWVFKPEYEKAIKKLFQTDSPSHKIENNIVIRPEGPIWDQ